MKIEVSNTPSGLDLRKDYGTDGIPPIIVSNHAVLLAPWLITQIIDFLAEYNLSNYSMFRCEWQNKKGGGVLFYVKANLNSTVFQTKKNIK